MYEVITINPLRTIIILRELPLVAVGRLLLWLLLLSSGSEDLFVVCILRIAKETN